MIRFTPSSNGIPEPGKVLLAEPFMADPHFGRKAILLCVSTTKKVPLGLC